MAEAKLSEILAQSRKVDSELGKAESDKANLQVLTSTIQSTNMMICCLLTGTE